MIPLLACPIPTPSIPRIVVRNASTSKWRPEHANAASHKRPPPINTAAVKSHFICWRDAKHEPLAIDLASTAVLVIDMQNDFGCAGGMFERTGIGISGIRATIGPTSRVLAAAWSHATYRARTSFRCRPSLLVRTGDHIGRRGSCSDCTSTGALAQYHFGAFDRLSFAFFSVEARRAPQF